MDLGGGKLLDVTVEAHSVEGTCAELAFSRKKISVAVKDSPEKTGYRPRGGRGR